MSLNISNSNSDNNVVSKQQPISKKKIDFSRLENLPVSISNTQALTHKYLIALKQYHCTTIEFVNHYVKLQMIGETEGLDILSDYFNSRNLEDEFENCYNNCDKLTNLYHEFDSCYERLDESHNFVKHQKQIISIGKDIQSSFELFTEELYSTFSLFLCAYIYHNLYCEDIPEDEKYDDLNEFISKIKSKRRVHELSIEFLKEEKLCKNLENEEIINKIIFYLTTSI
jgi:hypothetical protein